MSHAGWGGLAVHPPRRNNIIACGMTATPNGFLFPHSARIAFIIPEWFSSMRGLIFVSTMFFGVNSAICSQLLRSPNPSGSSERYLPASEAQNSDSTALWKQAKTAFDRGDFAEARRILALAVKANPKDAALWFHLGVACSQLDDVEQAIAALEHARVLAPRQPETYFDLGLLYWKSGDIGKAKQVYRAGLVLSPKEPSALQNYALLLMKTGEYKDAITPLIKLKNDPSLSVPTRVSLIECYLKTQQPEQADREADDLLRAGISAPEDQTKLAGIFLENGATKTAVQLLIHSLKADPDQDKASATLGIIYLRQKQFAEAAPLLEHAVQLAPNTAEYAMAFAQVLFLWDHAPALLAFLQSVKSKFAALPEFQFALALAYYKTASFTAAAATLESLLQTNPRRQDQIYFWLGNADLALGKQEDAERAYRKAIEINPKQPKYYENFATLLRRQGPEKLDDAIVQLKHAHQFDPDDPYLGLQLALCYESKDNLADATTLLEKAVQKEPDLLPAHIALARIYFRQERKAEAAKEKETTRILQERVQQQQMKSTTSPPNPLDEQP
jgi:tetratricopeptide (TPR) repeat protein